ncbi:dephospho-CoA kinase [Serpentinicella alkaliphila]|uniref:Dephospho-CoA kinase n=1 Tax=Serpentinicella alkaliphila TaxID=1734049 RepID=A0A4R2TYK6_9FIRM|nr:dephospho-CoA kinase [Serpentinicella alkaliphila]QUH26943.1 dephospho-CoA kinase [Serpentinicella alkaliphila]TCQ08177.1 dephospho-CoA kinase [Serpentinicella alkaliphila]
MKIIGLTGGIASGKSTVSNYLDELGAIIIDADKVARDIVERGKPALKEIVDEFGIIVLQANGELNRKKLGEIVFSNKDALEKLNAITHPKINEQIKNEINWHKHHSKNSVIILDAALMVELNLHKLVDELWIVYVPLEIQRIRLMNRDNITIEDANKRISVQLSNEEKLKLANRIICNSGTLEDLKKQVLEHWLDLRDSRI